MVCKNCNNEFEGKFCNQCGQPASVHKLNFHFLLHDIQHGLLHVDKGILYTFKELFKRPGHSIREYLEGKRVSHYKPISLVLVMAGAYGLLSHFFHVDILGENFHVGPGGTAELKKIVSEMGDWVTGHYALVSLLELPIYTLGTFIGFRKMGYNFVEHLVLNAFLTGQRLLLHILLFPILYTLKEPASIKGFHDSLGLVIAAVTLWTLFQFFNTSKKWTVFWRTSVSFLISWVIYVAIGLTIIYNIINQ